MSSIYFVYFLYSPIIAIANPNASEIDYKLMEIWMDK